jgi:hypothetical protein
MSSVIGFITKAGLKKIFGSNPATGVGGIAANILAKTAKLASELSEIDDFGSIRRDMEKFMDAGEKMFKEINSAKFKRIKSPLTQKQGEELLAVIKEIENYLADWRKINKNIIQAERTLSKYNNKSGAVTQAKRHLSLIEFDKIARNFTSTRSKIIDALSDYELIAKKEGF